MPKNAKPKYAQTYNPQTRRWVKIEVKTGRIVGRKRTAGAYRDIPKRKAAPKKPPRAEKRYYHLTDVKNFKPRADHEQSVQEFGSGLYITEESDVGFWDRQMQGREYAVPVDISKMRIVKEKHLPTMSEMSKDLKQMGYTGEDIQKLRPKKGTLRSNPFEIAVKRTWAKEVGFQGIIPKIRGEYSTEQLVIFDVANVKTGKPESTHELRLRKKLY